MTQHFHYSSPQTPTANRFDVDLGTSAIRLGDIPGWASAAEDGDVASNGVEIDDPTSTAGMSNDGILGLKTFYVVEDACAAVGADGVNGQRLWTGYITDRRYKRGSGVSPSLITGPMRRIAIDLVDLNALASFRVINASNTRLTGTLSKNGTTTVTGSGTQFLTELAVGSTVSIPGGGGTDTLYVTAIASDTSMTVSPAAAYTASGQTVLRIDGKRPAETDVQRVQWITSGVPAYFPVHNDAGFLSTSGPVNMDACDYTGQTPADVMHDCALQSGKNWFVLYWEASGTDCIWYDDSNTSVNYTSLLRLSNVLSDVDNTTTFAYMPDSELSRSPSRVFAGLYLPFANGYVYGQNASTANIYAWRDGTAPTSNVKSLTAANALATRLLADADSEDDRVKCKVQLPASLATGIKAGQRIPFRASHLGFNGSNISYDTFYWMRVARLSVAQDEATDQRYTLSLELSPQTAGEAAVCAASLGAAEQNWTWGAYNEGTPNPSVSLTPAQTGGLRLFTVLAAGNGNSPGAQNMGTASGWTTLDNSNLGARHTWYIGDRAGVAGVSYTASAVLGSQGFANDCSWTANIVAIRTSAAAPLQSAVQPFGSTSVDLPNPPTPGSLLVLVCYKLPYNGTVATPSGWTLIDHATSAQYKIDFPSANDSSAHSVYVFARCAVQGDTTQIAAGLAVDAWFAVEWPIL